VDEVCDAFEEAWEDQAASGGDRPRVEQYLADVTEPVRSVLLQELLEVEAAHRARLGEELTLGELFQRFPEFFGGVKVRPSRAAQSAVEQDRPSPPSALATPGGRANEVTLLQPAPEPVGTEAPPVPGYQIVAELGRGGMGVVYKAWEIGLNRFVALKMIREGALAGREQQARFRTEAEAMARLQHPNIVPIYALGEHQGRPFFTMELARGRSLQQRLLGPPFPVDEAVELVAILAGAVQHAHERNVIHRDLKPANVLQTGTGFNRVLITDFGLAKLLDSASDLTRSGEVLGTVSYMAPEQAAGRARDVGPMTDVHALGAILYELLTGRPPFRGETPLETLDQIRSQEPLPPSQLRVDVPPTLEIICLKCFQKRPEQRYTSAGALAAALQQFVREL
jgi:serine/threonine protein kinase